MDDGEERAADSSRRATSARAAPMRKVIMQLRQAGLTWHVTGDDVVVLDLEGSVYLKLNASGRVLWERVAASCTEAGLVEALVEHYAIDEERAAADVAAFLAELDRRELLQR